MLRRLLLLLIVAVAALAVTACGNKQDRTTHAETEGTYLDIGPMKYQVQISRLLNPTDREDKSYLVDLPGGQTLGPQDQWFAVFMRVENGTDKLQQPASRYIIRDTQGNVFRPVQMGPKNVFAYRANKIPPNQNIPIAGSAAEQNSIQGAMLLFKIPTANLENRPLELVITPPPGVGGPEGTVDLDV